MKVIPSYDQAKDIGQAAFGEGNFTVFQYNQKRSNLTLFGVEEKRTERRIWSQ